MVCLPGAATVRTGQRISLSRRVVSTRRGGFVHSMMPSLSAVTNACVSDLPLSVSPVYNAGASETGDQTGD